MLLVWLPKGHTNSIALEYEVHEDIYTLRIWPETDPKGQAHFGFHCEQNFLRGQFIHPTRNLFPEGVNLHQ